MTPGELDALPPKTWIEVTNEAGRFRMARVPGGWHLPGDLAVSSGDVLAGEPMAVDVLGDLFGDDPHDPHDPRDAKC